MRLLLSGLPIASLCAGFLLGFRLLRIEKQTLSKQLVKACDLAIGDNQDRSPSAALTGSLLGDRELQQALDRVYAKLQSRRVECTEAQHAKSTAEVRVRKAIAQNDQIKEIVSELASPILLVNQYEEVILSNAATEKLFDQPPIDPKNPPKLVTFVNNDEVRKILKEALRHTAELERTIEVEVNGGEYRISCRNHLIPNQEAPEGAVAVFTDISERKAIQQRNAEFVSSVSHEMKTPLSGIRAYVELLADGAAEDEAIRDEFLNVIAGQAERLQRLIDNLLNIARIEAGVVRVDKCENSLNEILQEAFELVAPSAEAKRIELQRELSPMYLGALSDRDMLLQSAINLLSNAIKYTAEGGKVTLRSRLTADGVEFEVADTGVGLSEEDQQRVFEKFYRVRKDENMAGGTGLGLPLAKHIVEEIHNGELTLSSKVGKGSTFRIALPPAAALGA